MLVRLKIHILNVEVCFSNFKPQIHASNKFNLAPDKPPNFPQESQIDMDAPHMDPAVVVVQQSPPHHAHPAAPLPHPAVTTAMMTAMPPAPGINTQTFTNQTFTTLAAMQQQQPPQQRQQVLYRVLRFGRELPYNIESCSEWFPFLPPLRKASFRSAEEE